MRVPRAKRRRIEYEQSINSDHNKNSTLEEVNSDQEENHQQTNLDSNQDTLSRQKRKRLKKRKRKKSDLDDVFVEKLKSSSGKVTTDSLVDKLIEKKDTLLFDESARFEPQPKKFDVDFDELMREVEQVQASEITQIQKSQKSRKLTNKKRGKIAASEIEQFKNVLQHPSFKSSPIDSIQQHLMNKVQQINKNGTIESLTVGEALKEDSQLNKPKRNKKFKLAPKKNKKSTTTGVAVSQNKSKTKAVGKKRKRS